MEGSQKMEASVSSKDFDSVGRKIPTRKVKTGSIQACETIRNRLSMSLTEFSIALGLGQTTYATFVRDSRVPKTVELACECLSRRQANSTNDQHFFMTVSAKGVVKVRAIMEDVEELTLRGKTYFLIEK